MPTGLAALLISIEVSGSPLPPDQRRAIETACSQAAGGRCVVGQARAEETPDAVAIVSLEAERRHALVEVGRRRGEQRKWLSRELTFGSEDDLIERLRSIGLTIATLVGDVQEREAVELGNVSEGSGQASGRPDTPGVPVATPKQEAGVPSAAGSSKGATTRRFRLVPMLALGVLAGPGLEAGSPRVGGFSRVSLRFGRFPIWPTLWFSHAVRPVDEAGLSPTWSTLSGGIAAGAYVARLRTSGTLRLEATLERLGVEQTRAPVDSGSRFVPGVRLGGDLTWPRDGVAGAMLSGDAYLFRNGTRIVVADRTAAQAPALNFTIALGAELRF